MVVRYVHPAHTPPTHTTSTYMHMPNTYHTHTHKYIPHTHTAYHTYIFTHYIKHIPYNTLHMSLIRHTTFSHMLHTYTVHLTCHTHTHTPHNSHPLPTWSIMRGLLSAHTTSSSLMGLHVTLYLESSPTSCLIFPWDLYSFQRVVNGVKSPCPVCLTAQQHLRMSLVQATGNASVSHLLTVCVLCGAESSLAWCVSMQLHLLHKQCLFLFDSDIRLSVSDCFQ